MSNFPLLDDVDFELAPNGEHRCTAILVPRLDRPILNLALRWALLGSVELPWVGAPIPSRAGSTVETTVAATVRMDYSVAGTPGNQQQYRFVRCATPELVGTQWRMPDGDVELFELKSGRTRRVDEGEEPLTTLVPIERRSSILCSWVAGHFEWYGKDQPRLSIQISGSPLAFISRAKFRGHHGSAFLSLEGHDPESTKAG